MMNSAFKFLIVTLMCLPFAGYAGSEAGGGGDPVAQEFVSTLRQISIYLEQNPRLLVKVSRAKTERVIGELQSSLGFKGKRSQVVVVSKRPVDEFGVPKAAVTTLNPLKIVLHHESWVQPKNLDRQAVQKSQVVLAGMELLLLASIEENRYETAHRELGPRFQEILQAQEVTDPAMPTVPADLLPLEKSVDVNGNEFQFVHDMFFQLLKNSNFSNCEVELRNYDGRTEALIKTYEAEGGGISGAFLVSSGTPEISLSRDDTAIRFRYNVRKNGSSLNATGSPVSGQRPLTGIMMYTGQLKGNQAELAELTFNFRMIEKTNIGTAFSPSYRYDWVKPSQKDFTCKAN